MKRGKVLAASILLAASMSGTAFAGEWKQDSIGWWYQNDDGSYPSNTWQWIDGNYDGIAESYFFDANGYCLMNTITPDGYTVDLNGAWTIDGIVQTQVTADTSVSASQTASAAPIQEASPVSSAPFDGYTIVVNTNTLKYHTPYSLLPGYCGETGTLTGTLFLLGLGSSPGNRLSTTSLTLLPVSVSNQSFTLSVNASIHILSASLSYFCSIKRV